MGNLNPDYLPEGKKRHVAHTTGEEPIIITADQTILITI